jgi:putative protease
MVESALLTDRYQKKFPVKNNCLYCYNIVYNSVPLSLHKELEKGTKYPIKRLAFTVETAEETKKILEYYRLLDEGMAEQLPFDEFTTGHEKRGVE